MWKDYLSGITLAAITFVFHPVFFCVLVGAWMNLLVVQCNGGKMPVPTHLPETKYHVPTGDKTKLTCLSDWISTPIGYASPGDVFILVGVLLAIGWFIKTLLENQC